jgi:hypothetical protein
MVYKENNMKKTTRLMAALMAGIAVFCLSCACTLKKGNGVMTSLEKPVSPFDSIQINGYAVVNFYKSQEYRAIVTVDSNLTDRIEVYTEGNALKIGVKQGRHCAFTQYTVDVFCPSIAGLSISGAARIKLRGNCSDADISISGTGDFSGNEFKTNNVLFS